MRAVLGIGKGLLKALFIRGCVYRNLCYELYWRDHLCDYGMRGCYGKERRNAAPSRASELRGA